MFAIEVLVLAHGLKYSKFSVVSLFQKTFFFKKSISNCAVHVLKLIIARTARALGHYQRGRDRSLTHTNLRFQVYTAIIYFKNNNFILKIIQYNWVYNIVGNLF